MAREQTLLERVASRSTVGQRSRYEASATEDVEALMESVRGQLRRILNARQGMSEAMPDYGLPAITDLLIGEDAILRVQEALRTTIEKYEPRLRRVRVVQVANEDHPHVLSFRVEAVLVGRSGEHRVWYETMVTGAGEFDVAA